MPKGKLIIETSLRRTELVSRAADGSSFECIVSTPIDGNQEVAQRKIVVKSLAALINGYSNVQ